MNALSVSKLVTRTTVVIMAFAACVLLVLALHGRSRLEAAATESAVDRIRSLIESNLPPIASDLMRGSQNELVLRLTLLRANLSKSGLELKIWNEHGKPLFESESFSDSVKDESNLRLGEHAYASGWMTSYRPIRDGLKVIGHSAFSIPIDQHSQSVFEIFVYQSVIFMLGFILTLVFSLQQLVKIVFVRPLHNLVAQLPIFAASVGTDSEPLQNDMPLFLELFQLHRAIVENYKDLGKRVRKEKALERELARKQVRDQLARQVAHDIRSPLSALNSAIPLLTSSNKEAVSLTQQAVRRITHIAADLIGKSEMRDAEQPKDLFAIHEIDKIVEAIIAEKQMEYRASGTLKIRYIGCTTKEATARVNAVVLERCLSNLLNNAIEAVKDNGDICARVQVTLEKVLIHIEDNGHGIAPELLCKLGDRGFSYGKTGMQSGSGLGVAQVKDAVQTWGGKLNFESKLGRGTRVTIQLPRTETSPKLDKHIRELPSEMML